tara:strand:+ start:454 stop:864 length:411 start_codon:yes stop_codon:yes gene_type:complete
MSYLKSTKTQVSLEWAAMLVGIVVICVSAYLIFGTDWNAYRIANVLIGVSFIVFITYSFANTNVLKQQLSGSDERNAGLTKNLNESNSKNEVLETKLELSKLELVKMESLVTELGNTIEDLEQSLAKNKDGESVDD